MAGAVEGAGFLGGGLATKGLGALAGLATRGRAYLKFASELEQKVLNQIKAHVPAFKDATRLLDVLQGQRPLSEAFEKSLNEVIKKGTGQKVMISTESAARLGFRKLPADYPFDKVPVSASELAQKMIGKSTGKLTKDAYHEAADVLDAANIGDPAARFAYRYGIRAANFLDETNSLAGETFRPERAMAGLTDKSLFDSVSGLPGFTAAIRGTEATPVLQASGGPLGRAVGGVGGFLVGQPAGHAFPGYIAGKQVGEAAGRGFTGVPELPVVQRLRQLGQAGGVLGGAGTDLVSPAPGIEPVAIPPIPLPSPSVGTTEATLLGPSSRGLLRQFGITEP